MIVALLIFICIISTLGFIVCSAIHISCMTIVKILEKMEVMYEERKSINYSNKKSIKK